MKILHSSDWHLGAYVGPQCDDPYIRTENTRLCLDKILSTTKKETPDIILITGDIFHQSRVWSDRAMVEVRIAIDYIRILSTYAPVCVLYGTPNHDNVEAFKMMEDTFGKDSDKVIFCYTPELYEIKTKSGIIQIAGVPGFDKGYFRAKYPALSAEEENKLFSQYTADIIQGLSAQIDSSIPSVLMAHHTVIGCELDNGNNVFIANEVVLTPSSLDGSNFDLVCLGHIHKAQRVDSCGKPVYYAGSIDANNFNDEGHTKGFYIHNIQNDNRISFNFIETPAREFQTFRWSEDTTSDYVAANLNKINNDMVKDKVVRVLYTCDSEIEKALDKKKLEKDLYNAGAYYVSEIRPEKIITSVNRERITEKMTVEVSLRHYLEEKKIENIDSILEIAIPLIAEANSNTISGGQTGIFLPLEIEVKNYRSYESEKVDFSDIYFAMVNGENGSGKSSLFMDALADCLYEKPREGELTGWIRTEAKSGSISFTFMLGNKTWRVTRTRQKSGKATLALSKLESLENQWQDHSSQKLVDTQQKIIDLLGMDSNTFQSCVLIMQDKYGIFLEAKLEERMAILANLLGLGIYEQLEHLAKEKLQAVNRDMRLVMGRIDALESEIGKKNNLNASLEENNNLLEEYNQKLKAEKEKEANTRENINTLKAQNDKYDTLKKSISSLMGALNEKKNNLNSVLDNISKTKKFLADEAYYVQQHNKFAELQGKLSELDGKRLILKEKDKSVEDKRARQAKHSKEIASLIAKLQSTDNLRIEKNSILENLATNRDIETRIKEQETVMDEHIRLTAEIQSLTNDIETLSKEKQLQLYNCQARIDEAEKKASMLADSNCIKVDEARCRFLENAIEAKKLLPELIEEKEKLSKGIQDKESEIKANIEAKSKALGELGYESKALTALYETEKVCIEDKQRLATIEATEKSLVDDEARLSEYKVELEELNKEIDIAEKELQELKTECANYEVLKKEYEALTSDEEKYHKLPAGKQYLESAEPQADSMKKDIDGLNKDIEQKKAEIEKIDISINIDELTHEHKAIKDSIWNLEQQIQSTNRLIGGIEEKLNTISAQEEEYSTAKADSLQLANKANQYQILEGAFSQEGIPHQIIRDIIPEIEASSNEILAQMTNGWMRVDFKTEKTLKSNKSKEVATLDIITTDVTNGEMPYLSRSGGQRTRINLAVAFALAMVKASRVGLQLGMLFVDEPSWLDEKGTEEYCLALLAIHNKYPDMRILAISHDASMKMNFPQQLYVERTEVGSKVSRV